MNHPTYRVIALPVILFALTSLGHSQSVKPTDNLSTEVIAARDAIRSAARDGDLATWNRLVSTDCRFVEPNGRITSRNWHTPLPSPTKSTAPSLPQTDVRLSQSDVRIQGDTAILTYREDTKSRVGDSTIVSAVRFTEVYRRTTDAWVMIASAETPIEEKKAVTLDHAIYDDYIGEYQMAPELMGKVYREGDKLMLIGTGWKQAYELSPLGHDTFFVKEMPNNEIVFMRDSAGKVIAQGPSENSQGPTGKKIK